MKPGDIFNPHRVFVGLFIPNALSQYSALTPAAKLCWGRLAQYAGQDGTCFPKQATLAAEIAVTERHARRLLGELVSKKFITILRPEGSRRLSHRTNRYAFLWHPIFSLSGEDTDVLPGKDADVPSYKGTEENHKKENQNPLSEQSFRLAELLLGLILSRKPDYKKPDLHSWAGDIDRMLRLDKRTPAQIEALIRWTQQDSFWQANILSAGKLREKFDQLELKMTQTKTRSCGQRVQGAGDRCENLHKYDAVPVENLS